MTPPDLLHLPHLKAAGLVEHDDHYVVTAVGQAEPTVCPECGSSSLHGHGSQKQAYMDTPMHGKRVIIELDRRRYRCVGCGKTLFASLPDIDPKRLATIRFVRHVEQQCLRKTFAELSREVGVDEKTIRHIFDDHVDRFRKEVRFETPEIMGIDALKIIGQYRAMITNVGKLSIFDMLPTRNKVDLMAYFRDLPDKQRVRVLTMDLWNVYRQVAEAQFPGRMIVADRWHMLRMSNDAAEKVRKRVRKEVDTRTRLKLKDDRFMLLARGRHLTDDQRNVIADWATEFPALVAAYQAKEAFHALYEHKTRQDAEKAAKEWLDALPYDVQWAFKDTATALRNWWPQVFNFYDCRTSNAYTESVNRLAKDMNRMGRGYSFEVIRAQLLYEEKARSVTRKAEYGPHIPTLCDMLESGQFE